MPKTVFFYVWNPKHHVINNHRIKKWDITKASLINFRHAWATTALSNTKIQDFWKLLAADNKSNKIWKHGPVVFLNRRNFLSCV